MEYGSTVVDSRNESGFGVVFDRLVQIMRDYEQGMVVKANEPGNYYLEAHPTEKYPKEIFFGAVRIGKSYVSYHLMPLYSCPDLLDTISPKLKKRMQGKSCFNFRVIDEDLAAELAELTGKGYERWRVQGML